MAGQLKKIDEPKYDALHAYYLKVKINGESLLMKIDSGCNNSIINAAEWERLGQPQLTPAGERISATRTKVDLKGKFVANVELYGQVYELPIQVSKQPTTRNLIGREWFPFIYLNWNKIFHHNRKRHVPIFQTITEKQEEQKRLIIASNKRTNFFYIEVKIENVMTKMMLDTGASQSKISLKQWEKIGKPDLEECPIRIVDTANQVLPLAGQCVVTAEYEGEKRLVPLIVTAENYGQVIGTNWFKYFRLDFNSIFENITMSQSVK